MASQGKWIPDEHFTSFAKSLELTINQYGQYEGDFFERQKSQIEGLLLMEKEFRNTLQGHRYGALMYRDFVKFICEERKNILAARPYFRERQDVFKTFISKILKNRDYEALYQFDVNHHFITFVMHRRKWSNSCSIALRFNAIEKLRKEIIEMNMPLAISRARIFYSRTQRSHLSYMDLLQIAAEGLMAAINKYSLSPEGFTRVFRAVVIGRMTGNFIDEYSDTVLHFYPSDKRKIYRANKAIGRFKGESVDYEKLATEVNRDVAVSHTTSPNEIAELMSAASTVSADSRAAAGEEIYGSLIDNFAAASTCQPDLQVEQAQAVSVTRQAIKKLTLFERKFLRLKGVVL